MQIYRQQRSHYIWDMHDWYTYTHHIHTADNVTEYSNTPAVWLHICKKNKTNIV